MKTPSTSSKIAQVPLLAEQRRTRPAPGEMEMTEFGRTIQSLIGKKGPNEKISEEALFAAAVFRQFKTLFGSEMAADFKSTFKLTKFDKLSSERIPSAERAAKEALKFFVRATIITKEEARSIRNIATQVAQLDDKAPLWDGVRGLDNSIAVTSFGIAQVQIQQRWAEAPGDTFTSSQKPTTSTASYQAEPAAAQPKGSKPSSRRIKSVG